MVMAQVALALVSSLTFVFLALEVSRRWQRRQQLYFLTHVVRAAVNHTGKGIPVGGYPRIARRPAASRPAPAMLTFASKVRTAS